MPIKVFIDGAEGTTGLRLHDRLVTREDVELMLISPQLRKDPDERARLSNEADVVFLCLPDAASKEAVSRIINPDVKIIDASTAHRVNDLWTYGLPELSRNQRQEVTDARHLCVPGCHASGFISLAYPLVREGIAAPDYPFTCHSVTGYSGAGKQMIAKYADPNRPECYGSPRQYALGQQHKHLPEMRKVAKLTHPPIFNPIIADFYAGMVVTVPLFIGRLLTPMGAKKLHAFFTDYYKGQKAIRVMPFGKQDEYEGAMLDAAALAGKDYMEIYVCGHEGQAALVARFDNLGKGASGAAIQCMNLMCGFDETKGLMV